MTRKAIYRHKRTGDLFAIETDGQGNVISTSGPLLVKDLNPDELDYDNYWDEDVSGSFIEENWQLKAGSITVRSCIPYYHSEHVCRYHL